MTARTSMTYRPDVDGLRAVAILLVVAFHVGLRGFSGGFLGVDVFFVISGYLITAILWREAGETGHIRWSRFYARRVRRLLPALVLTVVGTLILGVFLLVPDPELRWLGQASGAAAAFASNVFALAKTSSYFGADAGALPLLHTWSLAVEEQFYLIWPLVLLVAFRARGVRRIGEAAVGALLGGLAVGSLIGAEVMLSVNPAAAFYLMPFRLWELAAGGLLAIYGGRLPTFRRVSGTAVGALGLVAIIASAILADASGRFPGIAALPAVLGTVAIVAVGSSGSTNSITTVLSRRELVYVGKRSYSWYLIHWPLLVIVRLVTLETNTLRDTLIAVASLGLAAFSYRFVEQPFRLGGRSSSPRQTRTLLAGLATLVVVGLLGAVVALRSDSISQLDISSSQRAAMRENRVAAGVCPNPAHGSGTVACRFGPNASAARTLLLVGDSHTLAVLPAVKEIAASLGWGLEVIWNTGCPFGTDDHTIIREVSERGVCATENRNRLRYIADHAQRIGGVFVTGRTTSAVYTKDWKVRDGAPQRWGESLHAAVGAITAHHIPVFVMLDVPRFARDVPECLIRGRGDCDVAVSKARNFRRPASDAEVSALAGMAGVMTWDPFAALCNASVCVAQRRGTVFYRDVDHLSTAGATFLGTTLDGVAEKFFSDR